MIDPLSFACSNRGLCRPCGCSYRTGQIAKQSAREAREWDEAHGKLVDLSAFEREILPLIQDVPLSRLQKGTALSAPLRIADPARRADDDPLQ
jgi:hypothetical protein